MFDLPALFARLVVLVATLWTLAGLLALWRVTRRRVPGSRRAVRTRGTARATARSKDEGSPLRERLPPVSVLKPLCGADPQLEGNLETFFEQSHPDFELVFGVVDPRDPALQVVEKVRKRHPERECRTVIHAGTGALNPKIDNLLGLLPAARHDLVLVSDSNIRAPREYVAELAAIYAAERPGLVTNLFAGGAEDTLGAALESVELSSFCAAGVALPTALGDPLLVGKSALFSRSALERLGGLERLRDVLAEDFVLGKTFAHAGERVVLAPTVLVNVTSGATLATAFKRHLRWSMMRFRLRPVAAALEPLTSPMATLPIAYAVLGPKALIWALAVLLLRDVGGWLLLRGPSRLWVPLLLGPLRDLLSLAVWAVAPLKHHVSWRGRRFRLGAGTLLYAEPARCTPVARG